jgi:hypothetical protein
MYLSYQQPTASFAWKPALISRLIEIISVTWLEFLFQWSGIKNPGLGTWFRTGCNGVRIKSGSSPSVQTQQTQCNLNKNPV